MVMIPVNSMVFGISILMSCYCSEEIRTDQRWKRDSGKSLQGRLEMLTAQDEKINSLHIIVITSHFLPKCTEALKTDNWIWTMKCWKDWITQVKAIDQSTVTEIRMFRILIRNYYNGDQDKLVKTTKFIKENVEKGSDLATCVYEALLDDMDGFDHLYLRQIFYYFRFFSHTLRTITEIRNAEGDLSPIFTKKLPAVVITLLSGKEVFIRNNMTGDYMYAPTGSSNDTVRNILVNSVKEDDPRYLWKLKPVEVAYKEYNQESYYIVNSFDNKILNVGQDSNNDSLLKLVEPTTELLESQLSTFYILLVQDSSGEEVAIQSAYWGIKTIGLDQKGAWKMPKLLTTPSLVDSPSGVWLLQPKE